MFTSVEQFITQMKFRELRVQRDSARAAYGALNAELAAAPDEATQLRLLYAGLRNLRFAKQPLHPNVANLEPLLRDLDRGDASPETLRYWREELERELARGQLRAEVVYVFGALLEEWAAEGLAHDPQPEPETHAALLRHTTQEPAGESAARLAFLETLLTEFQLPPLAEQQTETRQTVDAMVYEAFPLNDDRKPARTGITPEDIVQRIANDRFRSNGLRAQAQRFLNNSTLLKELSDAVTILVDHIEEWDWPTNGVAAHTAWAGSKWRLLLDEDLPTACLLELLGARWEQALARVLSGKPTERIKRLLQLHELGAPAIIIQNEESLLTESGFRDLIGANIWADLEREAAPSTTPAVTDEPTAWGEPGSIAMRRASLLGELRSFDRFDEYGQTGASTGVETALRLVYAEIALGRAAFPNQPIYVTKLDLKDFYPSLPHDVLLATLTRLGLAQRDLDFFRRYLATRITDGDAPVVARKGVPIRRNLSDMLGEIVLSLLDAYVWRRANVQIVRLVDDIFFIATAQEQAVAAWQAVQTFCSGLGLALNDEKSGAVCIGGDRPAELPAATVRWQMLTLDNQGDWSVDEAAFARFLEQTRDQMIHTTSVIAQTHIYNDGLTYLERAVGLSLRLGATHRISVDAALRRYHRALFGENQGIVNRLQQAINERFLEVGAEGRLPEAWLYWPVTAGGLGLRQAGLRATFHDPRIARYVTTIPSQRSADWQRKDNEWARYYNALLDPIQPTAPTSNQVMETLVKDFIARGAGLSAGKQKSLSNYWRWVLYIYGPQILDAFGSFRFLLSELVPLQLLTERRVGDDED